jgi:hypothetical protein
MMPPDPPRICACVDPPHVENCLDCWGFGHRTLPPERLEVWGAKFVKMGTAPRVAADCELADLYARPCPTCHTGVRTYRTRAVGEVRSTPLPILVELQALAAESMA